MLLKTAAVALVALIGAVPAFADPVVTGPRLVVRGVAAQIQIIPEDRADYVAVIGAVGRLPAIEMRREGQTLVLDGKLHRRVRGCASSGGQHTINISGLGRVAQSALPVITIRAPRDVNARIANAGATTVGATRSASLGFDGCGDARIGAVEGGLTVELDGSGDVDFVSVGGGLIGRLDGSGDVRGGDVRGDAMLGLDGSGDIQIGAVGGSLSAELDGSGDIIVAAAHGAAMLSLDGSGDITVRGGAASRLVAEIDGSGNISFLGEARDVHAEIDGSGNIRIARATGNVAQSTHGSGRISVGR